MQLSFEGGFWGRLQVWLVAFFVFLLLPVSAIAAGDADIGEAYFTGATKFGSGAPPCISCHGAGIGALGGGTLGPDLTQGWDSRQYLVNAAWINNEGTPVMGAIFSKKNVTDEEAAHVKAFIDNQVANGASASGGGTFLVIGLVACGVILVLFGLIWGGRYRNRCKGTAHDALWRNYGGKGGK